MNVVIERLQDEPTPSDLFRWTEGGLPTVETAPGTRGIHVEERLADGTFVLLAELPGIDPDEDLGISVSDGVLTVRVHHCETTTESGRFAAYRYGTVVHAPLPAGARDDAAAEYESGVLTIRVAGPETKTHMRTVPVLRR